MTTQEVNYDELRRRTPSGMMHWAGTGAHGKTCRECKAFGFNGYYAKGGKHNGLMKPSPCWKYREYMKQQGARIPANTPACKYFDQAEHPKPLFEKS